MIQLCFATQNQNKLSEIQLMMPDKVKLISLKELNHHFDLEETGNTLHENSYQKAKFVWDTFNQNCFADDSGLEVEALNRLPGVNSAFYAGPQKNDQDNLQLLLKNLENTQDKSARFRTVITLLWNGNPFQFEGVAEGTIIDEKRGTNGFGYDPIFIPKGFDKTFAEMTLDEKNTLSHRKKAIEKLIVFLKDVIK